MHKRVNVFLHLVSDFLIGSITFTAYDPVGCVIFYQPNTWTKASARRQSANEVFYNGVTFNHADGRICPSKIDFHFQAYELSNVVVIPRFVKRSSFVLVMEKFEIRIFCNPQPCICDGTIEIEGKCQNQ